MKEIEKLIGLGVVSSLLIGLPLLNLKYTFLLSLSYMFFIYLPFIFLINKINVSTIEKFFLMFLD